jgi:hypothetical protein
MEPFADSGSLIGETCFNSVAKWNGATYREAILLRSDFIKEDMAN